MHREWSFPIPFPSAQKLLKPKAVKRFFRTLLLLAQHDVSPDVQVRFQMRGTEQPSTGSPEARLLALSLPQEEFVFPVQSRTQFSSVARYRELVFPILPLAADRALLREPRRGLGKLLHGL